MYTHHASVVLLIGFIMIVLSAFGVALGSFDMFKLGCGVCFISFPVSWWRQP